MTTLILTKRLRFPYVLTVTAEADPDTGFSVTAEESTLSGGFVSAGCQHGLVLEHFPHLAPVVALHLSDPDGVPMHAVENALYWAGCTEWQPPTPENLARHLRIDQAEAGVLIDRLLAQGARDRRREFMVQYVDAQRPRWKEEAARARAIVEGREG